VKIKKPGGLLIVLTHATIKGYKSKNKNYTKKTKMRYIQSKFQSKSLATARRSATGVFLASLFLIAALATPFAHADQFQEQIDALNAENGQKQAVQGQLGAEASGLAETISKLQAQINALQTRITENESKMAELKIQIAAAEAELLHQRDLLGQTIRAMYLEGEITTVEMLATSKDLSDYFDKQQYRESVNSKIKTTLDKITKLKLDLNTQKETVEKLLAEQKSLQSQLAGQRAENSRLLSLNQAQQNEIDGQIKANNSKVAELRRQQIIANSRFSGGPAGTGPACGGGYPAKWCEIPQDSTIDSWGMYNRECVSYTAFRVAASGRHMPYWGGVGNANQWDDNARAAGIPADGNPQAGDVAISNGGAYGHAMYVESVNGNGTINISQYNANLDGRFSTRSGVSAAGLVFIHF
jgi:surface antigen